MVKRIAPNNVMRYAPEGRIARQNGAGPPSPGNPMPRPAKEDGHNRAGRYRAQKRRLGMRLLRIWVPDPRAPGFREEARRQAALLRGAPEEQEALDFIEGVMAADDSAR